MKTEDMVSICEDLHSYVPSTSTEHTVDIPGGSERFKLTMDHFHYILLGMYLNHHIKFPVCLDIE